jgi:hypothetical protein
MLLKNDCSTNELPPLHDPFNNFNLAYDATQKSNVLNKYFCSITKLNDDDLHTQESKEIGLWLDGNDLFPFIPGHSTGHQLIELYHRILLALEAKQVTTRWKYFFT